MKGTHLLILGFVLLAGQAFTLKILWDGRQKTTSDVITLSAEVKTYIDARINPSPTDEQLTALLKKLTDLEGEAGRLGYLRSTISSLEEAQLRLGKLSESRFTETASPMREREIEKFKLRIEEFCSSAGAKRFSSNGGS